MQVIFDAFENSLYVWKKLGNLTVLSYPERTYSEKAQQFRATWRAGLKWYLH